LIKQEGCGDIAKQFLEQSLSDPSIAIIVELMKGYSPLVVYNTLMSYFKAEI